MGLSIADKLHEEAMQLTDKAIACKKRGQFKAARRHYQAALELESQAAWECSKIRGWHKSSMILHASAAAIAQSIMSVNLPAPQPPESEAPQ